MQTKFLQLHPLIVVLAVPTPIYRNTRLLHTVQGGSYLWNAENQAVFLAGDHTWTNNISLSKTGQFDFGGYLDLLSSEGANLIRYWKWAGVTVRNPDAGTALIQPFQRGADG